MSNAGLDEQTLGELLDMEIENILRKLKMTKILNDKGEVVQQDSEVNAIYAFWILTAHELLNGRVASYRLNPAPMDSSPEFLQQVGRQLPSWALDILRSHDLLREVSK